MIFKFCIKLSNMEITKHKYTITEKDGFYIVKPLLGDKVDTNLLMDLKYFAKGLLGEFSDESKYDGFLFQTMEYAEKFGARIDNYVNTNQIIIHNNESEDISVKTKVSNPEYNIYFLYESILKIVNYKGVDFLNDKLAIRDLTRFGAFKELPKSIEFIVFNFI